MHLFKVYCFILINNPLIKQKTSILLIYPISYLASVKYCVIDHHFSFFTKHFDNFYGPQVWFNSSIHSVAICQTQIPLNTFFSS